ncbi:MAG: hypothetical protein KKA44_16605 [Alphaproteobacteria bacterium]|nr:hypothetical protein [Alphaproteobacteria bacterium]MBU0863389.1 hypothetical protein [Alphaproteobacteria bacterium]MBU1826577.1 hypothetical protein [Alphaproteobacteria bacterium]
MTGHDRLDEACGRYAPLSPSRRALPSRDSFPMCYGTELAPSIYAMQYGCFGFDGIRGDWWQ